MGSPRVAPSAKVVRPEAEGSVLCQIKPARTLTTASSRYEEACRERGILAKFARAAREGRLGDELDLGGQGLGDAQLEALLKDPELLPLGEIRRWRLRDVRLTCKGVKALAAALRDGEHEHTDVLDLSRNEIAKNGAEALSAPMCQGLFPQLRRLDLSVNELRSEAMGPLVSGLLACPALLRLELNHNAIQDGVALGKLAAEHKHLMRLSLHCNFLSGGGAASLFKGILKNSREGGRLADVDVAWNGIGDSGAIVGSEAIAAVLRESSVLYHLDLSYNRLDSACCAVIGGGLRDNHSLYGLHLVGNSAFVDADGFLQPLHEGGAPGMLLSPKKEKPTPSRFGDPRSGAVRRVGNNRGVCGSSQCQSGGSAGTCSTRCSSASVPWSDDEILRERDVLEQQTTCWACEGWERVELSWPLNPQEPEPKAVWAFTSLDGFQTGLRLRRATDQPPRFSAARMVPGSCEVLVMFQVDSALRLAPGAPVQLLAAPAEVELRACEELPLLDPPPDQDVALHDETKAKNRIVVHRFVLRMGSASVVERECCVVPPTAEGPLGKRVVLLEDPGGAGAVQMPRVTESEFRMKTKSAKAKTFFSAFKRDTTAVLDECLSLDWSRAKVSRIVAEEERLSVQEILQRNYRKFVAIYRTLSALGVSGDTGFGVGQIEAGEIITSAGLVDDTTKLSDIDRLFIASKVMAVDMRRDVAVRNDKALVRHQVLELLLRIADQRFVQTKAVSSISEGLSRVLEALGSVGDARVEEVEAFFTALHTETVDAVYKRYFDLLMAVYQRYSGRLTPPGLANFMSLTEFQDLMEKVDAYDCPEFVPRKSAVAFRMGMMTQPEESMSSRFQEMSFLEFQHAIGAVVFMRAGSAPNNMAALVEEFFSTKLRGALPSKSAERKPTADLLR